MASPSVYTSMLGGPASWTLQNDMACIHAPSVVTPAMGCGTVLETDLSKVLYILPTPYKLAAWLHTLLEAGILVSFPNVIHDISYGSPIGNLSLSSTFLPHNLASAMLHPEIIDLELNAEVSSNCMSGPFSISQASSIFGGFFHSSPVCLVEKVPGNGNWCMIRHCYVP